jgi:mannose-1-phosphate guanylyltransferase
MAGGIGTRFWPLSKVAKPKQFIDVLGNGSSLIQSTFSRFERICPRENIYIVTNNIYRDIVNEQIPSLNPNQIITEPLRRNTAPCLAYANKKIYLENHNANIVVTPADHYIIDEDDFEKTVRLGLEATKKNDILVTLGIKPTYPNTGYGYIQYMTNEKLKSFGVNKVKLFTEKPSLEMAVKFIASGDFLWNSGMFIWSLKSINKAMKAFLPDVYKAFDNNKFYNTPQEEDFINEIYATCRSISIDYGIMEQATNVYVIPSNFGWSDVGSWGALYNVLSKDEKENSVVGKNVMLYDTKGCCINNADNKLMVLEGMEDCIVVNTKEALLVCKRDNEQRIKEFVTNIEMKKTGEHYL